MSDFSVSVGADFSEILAGFRKLEQQGKQAGENVGKGLAEGLQGFSSRSITALQAELSRLQARQLKVAVDSTAFEKTGQKIKEVQALLDQVQRQRLAIGVDSRSIVALNARLGDLQDELNRVQIGSQRFKELQAAVRETEQELQKAGQAVDGFNIIDGAIQGLAFSLTNTVTNAIGTAINAIGGLINGFAELDTEIRQAAAASGETGAYDKIARTIDQVGIEAAGTQMQVAQLATELVRGGMTVDQVNASLGAIVRGAEATGTGFAEMGSVVSASLKGFGLQAADSRRVVDALVTGANASATSVSGMGMAFKYAAPVARILGVSVEELGIAVGLLTNAGIEASEAGVTLRNGLSKLASAAPSTGGSMVNLTGQAKMAADTMKQLGINIYNADGTLQPMETTLLKLKGAFDKLDPSTKIRMAANMFGGEDDGTKWLALLNQSEADIKKMSATMANTKGATDVARDAMQGFQMAMNQLTGTMDSLGKTLGGVAAAALTPLVGVANQIIGVIAGLPTPVKQVGAALIIVAGATVAATAAMVIFQRAMTVTVIQSAATEIKMLALAMTANLKGAATVAIVAIDLLIKAVKGFTIQSFFDSVTAIGTAVKVQMVAAFGVARESFNALVQSIKSGAFASAASAFIGQIGSITVGILKFAYAIGPIALAIGIASKAMEGSAEAGERYKKANDTISDALVRLRKEIDQTNAKIEDNRNILQKLWDSFGEGARVMGDIDTTNAISKTISNLTKESTAYLASLKNVADLTDKQRSAALSYAEAQNTNAKAARELANQYKTLAEKAALIGDKRTEAVYKEAAALLLREADAANKVAQALDAKAKSTSNEANDMKKQINASMERANAARELANQYKTLAEKAALAGDKQREASYKEKAAQMLREANAANKAAQALDAKAKSTSNEIDVSKERIKVEQDLNKILSEAPIRQLESQLAVTQQLLSLSKALDDREQSRFNVVKSRLQFELKTLEQRGAGESVLAAKKAEIDGADRVALSTRYRALMQQQALEMAMLSLSQQKARIEADLSVKDQQIKLMEAEKKLRELGSKASNEDRLLALAQINLQQAILGLTQEKVSLLAQTQPLERNTALVTAEIARNGLQAQAAADGYRIAADGTLVRMQGIVASLQNVSILSGASADAQARFMTVAEQSGLAISRAADGSLVLGRSQQEVYLAAQALNAELGRTADGAAHLTAQIGGSADNLAATNQQASDLNSQLNQNITPATSLAKAFEATGKNAPAAVQEARNFASFLSTAKVFMENIRDIKLETTMSEVRNRTREAANAAKDFYNALSQASALPGSRWTGGPVDAGGEYRINELGQEAFLSAGRLSLINAPQNAIWRAPASGVVIPAGITARMKEIGVVPTAGGSVAGVADLALEVGKLRAEVGSLARKEWSVYVQQKIGPTASQVMNQIHRLR